MQKQKKWTKARHDYFFFYTFNKERKEKAKAIFSLELLGAFILGFLLYSGLYVSYISNF